ncbi:MAG: hypothetical protein CVV28_01395 [Methanobacteriales archaeon HGW-Methanobacteriales-1]|jgi:hypothetical protein|nr:MAG: hypothetical protein CVV28_01395 [Methanobacteriales archaeon HGW-Methanobacteriales-1]
MVADYFLRALSGFFLKHKVLSIGTKYYPTNNTEREYVEMINYTQTMLIEIEKANITTNKIFENLISEVGKENIPDNKRFIEIKPAEDRVDEYALLSNIIMGSDRYLYVEVFNKGRIVQEFADIIKRENGTIVEQSLSEIVAKLLSKNDAIRVAIDLIRVGNNKDISVRAAVGMTGAASIERSINLNREIGEVSGVGFTKLGGEFAVVFPSKFSKLKGEPLLYDNYLFIDVIDSTKFIDEKGRDHLVEIMNDIKAFIEKECKGKIEGYREGGDDLIANFPTKDLALKAGIDSAWHALNNGAKIRAGIGKSRREAGERAQLADGIKLWNPSSLIVFDVADGVYGYFIPSEFARSIMDFVLHKKSKAFLIFLLVFFATVIGWNIGYWQFGIVAIFLAVLYAITT